MEHEGSYLVMEVDWTMVLAKWKSLDCCLGPCSLVCLEVSLAGAMADTVVERPLSEQNVNALVMEADTYAETKCRKGGACGGARIR